MEKFSIFLKDQKGNDVEIQIKQKHQAFKSRKIQSWSNEEDQQLLTLYQKYQKNWILISSKLMNRSPNQCLHRFRKLQKVGEKKKWSKQQDAKVVNLIQIVGKDWKILSNSLGTKTAKQIRDRYINKLDPNINKNQWTKEEDRKIIQLYFKIGSKWCQISKQFIGRPQNKIKNRFYSFIVNNYEMRDRIINKEIKINERELILKEQDLQNR